MMPGGVPRTLKAQQDFLLPHQTHHQAEEEPRRRASRVLSAVLLPVAPAPHSALGFCEAVLLSLPERPVQTSDKVRK